VEARAQTAFYRVGKFVRRRWIAVSVASVFLVGITAAAVVAAIEARAARAEALKSEQVNRFLTEMVAANGVDRSDPGKFTVEQMLDAADRRLENTQEAQKGGPLTLAVLHKSLAAGYLGQQRYDKVQFHLDRAIPAFRAAGDDRQLAESLVIQARSEVDQGHYGQAERLFQESLATFRRMGKDAPAIEVFGTKRDYAQLLSLLMHTRPAEARALYDEMIAMGARDRSIPRFEVAAAVASRSGMLVEAGKFDEAEAAALEVLAIGRKEGPEGIWEWQPLFTLTQIYYNEGKYKEAKEAAQRMVDVSVRSEGPDSLLAAQAKNIWAGFAAQTGETAAAAVATRESMRVIEKLIRSPSLNLWHAARNASNVMRMAGEFTEAEHYARESLDVIEAAHVADNDARPGNSWEALGRALMEQKKYAEAVAAIQQAEKAYRSGGKTWSGSADRMHKLASQLQSESTARR
jgi:eukaryotic-like serine/threonine-protein kinase